MRELTFRKATESDSELYYRWTNDPLVRLQSYNSEPIAYDEHIRWFGEKLRDCYCHFYLFKNDDDQYVGQVRIQQLDDCESIIGISVDSVFRGFGLGIEMLNLATDDYLKQHQTTINAYIKVENVSSKLIFEKSGFQFKETVAYNNFESYHYIKYANRE